MVINYNKLKTVLLPMLTIQLQQRTLKLFFFFYLKQFSYHLLMKKYKRHSAKNAQLL